MKKKEISGSIKPPLSVAVSSKSSSKEALVNPPYPYVQIDKIKLMRRVDKRRNCEYINQPVALTLHQFCFNSSEYENEAFTPRTFGCCRFGC